MGSGVAELTKNRLIDQRVENLVRLKYILDVRDFPDSPYRDCFVKDFLCRATPSGHRSGDYRRRHGGAGLYHPGAESRKSVVSANKEWKLHGHEKAAAAGQGARRQLSVRGQRGRWNPHPAALTSCLAANELSQVTGILNGTTNYILPG